MGDLLPNRVVDFYMANFLLVTETVQQYFQKLRPLEKLDEQDGVAMGEAFTLEYTKKEKQNAKD